MLPPVITFWSSRSEVCFPSSNYQHRKYCNSMSADTKHSPNSSQAGAKQEPSPSQAGAKMVGTIVLFKRIFNRSSRVDVIGSPLAGVANGKFRPRILEARDLGQSSPMY